MTPVFHFNYLWSLIIAKVNEDRLLLPKEEGKKSLMFNQ